MADAKKIEIPEFAVVALMGASGSGKSSFAAKHFLPTEVISSDRARGLVSDDENDQTVSAEAFDLVHYIAGQRLKLRRLAVIDATNTQRRARKPIVETAKAHHAIPVAIVLDVSADVCHARNENRGDRAFGAHVPRRQSRELRKSIRGLRKEGFRQVYVLRSPEEIEAVEITRTRLWVDKRDETGPFDVIGDIHGCFDELVELLEKLGYSIEREGEGFKVAGPEGRKAIFLGDFVDRGPNSPDVLRLAISMMEAGIALAVPGNHDSKLVRSLEGRNVQVTHGLAETLEQLEPEGDEFKSQVHDFLKNLISHYVLDEGRLVVAHAGMPEAMQNRGSGRVREFALYGETTGETDEYGLPQRVDWAADYRGDAMVLYGHTPVVEPEWVNNTLNIDTGCVFGGKLTALRYPERELVSVPARQVYYEPLKPAEGQAVERAADVLDRADVFRGGVQTRLRGRVTVREENAAAALEVMSRWAVDPRWLVYLPPTMSPCGTSQRPDLLEHPDEAFGYYVSEGVANVVCQEKHMGSRMIAVICRDEETAVRKFASQDGKLGACFTRTGREFFRDPEMEAGLIARLAAGIADAGVWDELSTGWLVLDCELMPWSLKAQSLIESQYAPVGAAGAHDMEASRRVLAQAKARGLEIDELASRTDERAERVARYGRAYGSYSWPVESTDDLKVAPFHVLASEGVAHFEKPHSWHLGLIDRICAGDKVIAETGRRHVDLTDQAARDEAVEWWLELTGRGLEGMVVKPEAFTTRGRRGTTQPGVKCRGPEYLRIIYGPEYDLDGNLERLRSRGLGRKRSMAQREYALGVEALERFSRDEPLYRVHECVFGVLALESEPVDPRL